MPNRSKRKKKSNNGFSLPEKLAAMGMAVIAAAMIFLGVDLGGDEPFVCTKQPAEALVFYQDQPSSPNQFPEAMTRGQDEITAIAPGERFVIAEGGGDKILFDSCLQPAAQGTSWFSWLVQPTEVRLAKQAAEFRKKADEALAQIRPGSHAPGTLAPRLRRLPRQLARQGIQLSSLRIIGGLRDVGQALDAHDDIRFDLVLFQPSYGSGWQAKLSEWRDQSTPEISFELIPYKLPDPDCPLNPLTVTAVFVDVTDPDPTAKDAVLREAKAELQRLPPNGKLALYAITEAASVTAPLFEACRHTGKPEELALQAWNALEQAHGAPDQWQQPASPIAEYLIATRNTWPANSVDRVVVVSDFLFSSASMPHRDNARGDFTSLSEGFRKATGQALEGTFAGIELRAVKRQSEQHRGLQTTAHDTMVHDFVRALVASPVSQAPTR